MNKKFEEEAKGEAYQKLKNSFQRECNEENRQKTFWYTATYKKNSLLSLRKT